MGKLITLLRPAVFMVILLAPVLLAAMGSNSESVLKTNEASTETDSFPANRGHCSARIRVDADCATQTVTLSAFQFYIPAGYVPYVAHWSTGEYAHKIVVTPPGTWSWDHTYQQCYHPDTERTLGPFFNGNLEISGPSKFCLGVPSELVISNPYPFKDIRWEPASVDGSESPYTLLEPGTYQLTVVDQYDCPFTDEITINPFPPLSPTISGSNRICTEGDTNTVQVNEAFHAYYWNTGESTNLISITEPGVYEVTVSDQDGCTGIQSKNVASGDISEFSISLTAPAICPGQADTLRVVGGFSQYKWSNNVSGITNIVTQPGLYAVTVTNSFGCTATGAVTVGALPTPNISLSSSPLCAGDTTMLIAVGGTNLLYSWSNGQTTNSISVAAAGTYSVTVNGSGMCPNSDSVALVLFPSPTIAIDPPPQIDCITPQIPLNALASSSGSGFTFKWTTVEGNIVSGHNTLTPIVDTVGAYFLQITNDTSGCSASALVTVISNTQVPPAVVGPSDTLTCALTQLNIGSAVIPTDSTLLPSWTASMGGILHSGQNAWNPQVDQPGLYTLTVTNPANGCSSASSVLIEQNITPALAIVTQPDEINCTVNSAVLDGTGSSNGSTFDYLWTTSDGAISGTPNALIVEAASAGTYTLIITNTANGCTAAASVNVATSPDFPQVNVKPPAILTCNVQNIIIDASGSSSGPMFNYTWSGPNIISGQSTLQPMVSAPGTYTLLLTDNTNNCSATLSVFVPQDIVPPTANSGQNTALDCTAPTLSLNGTASDAGSAFATFWTTLDGNIVFDTNSLTPTIDKAGNYTLWVTNLANGCTSSSTVQVLNDANAPLAAIVPPETLTCNTLQTILNGETSTQGPNFNFVWSGPGFIGGQNTLQPTINTPGVYTLEITSSANGCTDTDTILVTQDITAPIALAGNDAEINCFNPTAILGSISNPAGSEFTFLWTTLGGNFTSPTNVPIASINTPGTYQLLITNITNGCMDSDDVIVVGDFLEPTVDAGPGFELTCVQTVTTLQGLGSTGAHITYLWTTSDGFIQNGANTLNPTVNADGTYNLLISNILNGCTSTDQVIVSQSADVPHATIAPAPTLTCSLNSINLNAIGSSVNPSISYFWSATNGGNISYGSTSLTPTIDAPGVYTLQIFDSANNCSSTATVIVVENIISPIVDAGNDNTLTCTVLNLSLTASLQYSASPNVAYSWTTSDGIILSGGNTPTPTIAAAGIYSVQVTDPLNGCSATDALEVLADIIPPVVGIAVPPILNCDLAQTTLDASASSVGTHFNYQWSTTNGNILSGTNVLNAEINQEGTYSLLISNTLNGCTNAATVLVLEDIVHPIANAGATAHLDCYTPISNLQGMNSSQGPTFSYQWTTVDGQILSGANTLNPQIGQPGTYLLSIENTQNGCTASASVLAIQDFAPPVFSIAAPAMLTCANRVVPLVGTGTGFGNTPVFTWSTTDGNILSGSDQLIVQVDTSGTYTLTIQNTENGCTDSQQVLVTGDLASPPLNTLPVLPLTCNVTERVLSASTIHQAQVLWSTLDGNFVSGYNTLNPVVNAPGLYSVQVTSALNGCTAQAQVTVLQEQNVPIGLQFSLEPPLCNGLLGFLTIDQMNGGVGPYEYSMDGGQSFVPEQVFDGLEPGDYALVVRDQNGCKLTQNLTVPTPFTPNVDLLPAFDIRLGEELVLQAILPPSYPISLIDQIIWLPSTGLSFAGNTVAQLLSPVAQPFRTTEYELTILTKEGCKASARTTIRVNQILDIYAPNVIWPEDPDGQNAAFTLFTRPGSVHQILSLQIYDRWGEQLFFNRNFKPDDPSFGWPGDARGMPVNPGVYVWWAELELVDGQNITLKGDVTVVR